MDLSEECRDAIANYCIRNQDNEGEVHPACRCHDKRDPEKYKSSTCRAYRAFLLNKDKRESLPLSHRRGSRTRSRQQVHEEEEAEDEVATTTTKDTSNVDPDQTNPAQNKTEDEETTDVEEEEDDGSTCHEHNNDVAHVSSKPDTESKISHPSASADVVIPEADEYIDSFMRDRLRDFQVLSEIAHDREALI